MQEIQLITCSIVIWAVLDPANPFIAPASAPFVIGLVSFSDCRFLFHLNYPAVCEVNLLRHTQT